MNELKRIKEEVKDLRERVPALAQRCPKCHKLSLEYDPEKGSVRCKSCGFEVWIKKT